MVFKSAPPLGWWIWLMLSVELRAWLAKWLVFSLPDPNSHYVITLKAFNNVGEGIPVYESAITRPQSGEPTAQTHSIGSFSSSENMFGIAMFTNEEDDVTSTVKKEE